ncbi:MAG: DUF362 domain-containing protein [candidate division Zixibacteria bacterium]
MKRRDFIRKTAQATALAAVTGTTGWLFHNREISAGQKLVISNPDYRIADNPELPKIVLAHNEDHIQALRASLDAIGGIKRFIRPGERVVVKPNVGWDRTPEQAANTNPLLVGEMIRQCLSAGASQVIVTDVTCNFAPRCFIRSGIRKATESAGGIVMLPRDEDYVRTDMGGKILTIWPVLKHFIETDKLINMPIVKHHSLSSCTIGMKNLYGILGGRRNQLHQEIDQSIVDLVAYCKPTLTVVDATRVLMRGGPTGGSLDDVSLQHSVICATDPVAADARGAEFLGVAPDKISHIILAEKNGLGMIDYLNAGYKEIAA